MNNIFRYMLLPALAPILFFSVAATPVELFGCRTRGLLALMIALVAVLAGLVTAIMALKSRVRRDPAANWWILSSLILAIPAMAVLVIAGNR
jgi:heme O synthase-like polyprenyltransferase